jgi:ABC-type multidrug transport system ATPase subunit
MSEPILMALVQLFAIVSVSFKNQRSDRSRAILASYLRQHLNNVELDEYLKLFDELISFHIDEDGSPMTEASEVPGKIRQICERIQKQLAARDRLIVFIKFLEFIDQSQRAGTETHTNALIDACLDIFKEVFNFSDAEFMEAKAFVFSDSLQGSNPEHLLVIGNSSEAALPGIRYISRERLHGQILVLYIPSVRVLICRYTGSEEVFLNGHIVPAFQSFLLNHGAILRSSKMLPVYYSDIAEIFLQSMEKIATTFTVKEVEYRFKNSSNGIHPFSFTARSGELIGVMGGSGVGKSTLLNVLNGNLPLKSGSILINGHDLEKEKDKLQGIIGFVPQDDLLIDELTVFQNLYYNAKLCFRDFTKKQLIRAVIRVLMDIGLVGIKNLAVGDPLNKFISGGQRKRLNIALELIREPAVLFADEPTSGLSSMDSEMVMMLLKEQTHNGKLVIVNIHQPSTDIYKLFDKLLIMDKGGYPIYYGNPIDALTWFKTASQHVNPDESECQSCGYVNPEQLFQITEARIINEHGRVTGSRKTSSKEWYELFRREVQPNLELSNEKTEVPKSDFKIPGILKQFRIFSIRNLLTKITNRQYMLINLLEGPVLAALLAYLTRYSPTEHYLFGSNRNLVPYLFMSVVVSLFLGMMVSAEEIIKDRKILKREAFLNLSHFSYINSKVILLFALSAIQTILYVITGNLILGIHDMILSYWLILFSTSCFANMVGLNISAGLNSVVAIYILIPFILVPQLLLSGTIVPFDYLNPSISTKENVPLVGNLMTSRWTFEALAVEQFKNNRYEKIFYPFEKEISHYSYITSYKIPVLKADLEQCQRNIALKAEAEKTEKLLTILKYEVGEMSREAGFAPEAVVAGLEAGKLDDQVVQATHLYLDSLSRKFSLVMGRINAKKDALYQKMVDRMGNEALIRMKQESHNENIADLVLNKGADRKISEGDGRLIRKMEPVMMDPVSRNGQAHFYAPVKILGSWRIDTLWFNFGVIWLMSLVLYFTLLFDVLRNGINWFEGLKFRKR